jgi:orotidine-5'-phosphate decarboxylase
MAQHFADRLAEACRRTRSVVCVGLDPRPDRLPESLSGGSATVSATTAFCRGIIDAVADIVPAVKPNIAFFEALGTLGVSAYADLCLHARDRGLLVIGDVKRGDIGSTAAAYARGLLGRGRGLTSLAHHDALTLNAYLGWDGVQPFAERAAEYGQGLFLLVKTSNPSSAQLQDRPLAEGGTVAQAMAALVQDWGAPTAGACGFSHLGAVVGATHGEELAGFREQMPGALFLLPGYGAQGAGAADVVPAFRADGLGGLVNASRSIIFAADASGREDFAAAAREAAVAMRDEINQALAAAGKGPA